MTGSRLGQINALLATIHAIKRCATGDRQHVFATRRYNPASRGSRYDRRACMVVSINSARIRCLNLQFFKAATVSWFVLFSVVERDRSRRLTLIKKLLSYRLNTESAQAARAGRWSWADARGCLQMWLTMLAMKTYKYSRIYSDHTFKSYRMFKTLNGADCLQIPHITQRKR